MDLARIALIAAVCLVDGIWLLWDWNAWVRRRVAGGGLESLARSMGSPLDQNRWAGGAAMCRTPGCARP
jgi:hypothetical protein